MDSLRLATVSINQTPLDWEGNYDRIKRAIEKIAPESPDIICFPELSVSGYGCEDAFHSLDIFTRSMKIARKAAKDAYSILPHALIYIGLPVRHNDQIYNCMAALHCGDIIALIPKQNLAGDGVHYEPRWFTAWRMKHAITDDGIPFGQIIVEHENTKIALEICEDSWVSARPALQYSQNGVDIILNPSASHFSFGKQNIRKNIAAETSRQFGIVFASVNLLGCEAGRIIYDGGSIIASGGEIIFESGRFSFKDFSASVLDADLTVNRTARSRIYSRREQHSSSESDVMLIKTSPETLPAYGNIGFGRHDKKDTHDIARKSCSSENTPVILSKEEEFARSVTLGLFDYMRKSKSRGYVISLSGGIDSSTCAVLVQRMIHYAAAELGIKYFLERLGVMKYIKFSSEKFPDIHPQDLADDNLGKINNDKFKEIIKFLTSQILYTIYQSTENSGEITRNAAFNLADFLGTEHFEASIGSIVKEYTQTAEKLFHRTLSWETDDLTLQNIQARARSPLAWMMANITGSLLITTSNRSEAAVGYCTMDGDTSGGLAPLAGVDKAYLKKWLRHMEIIGDSAGAIPVLKYVNDQQPTAELRPPEQHQSDEKDLMPYELLDVIERLAIRDRKSPVEIYRTIKINKMHPFSESGEKLKTAIERFFRLWSINQWKRERYAISFHLDDESLDPRNWYRFPVLNGGYAEELKDLMELAE